MVGFGATLAMLMMSQPTAVVVQEPRRPAKLGYSAQAACNGKYLYSVDYGLRYPDAPARLLANRRPVAGASIGRLLSDLSSRRAAYRITFECEQKGSALVMRVYRAEPQQSGQVNYSVSRATLVGGRLEEYRGPEITNAETFWFR